MITFIHKMIVGQIDMIIMYIDSKENITWQRMENIQKIFNKKT